MRVRTTLIEPKLKIFGDPCFEKRAQIYLTTESFAAVMITFHSNKVYQLNI